MSAPAHKIRDGVLAVVIWRNTGERGTYYTVNPSRSFKSGDDTWKESDSLNADDLLAMAELLPKPTPGFGCKNGLMPLAGNSPIR